MLAKREPPIYGSELAMKTIGLIGGMSWESTALYYRVLNESVKERLGGLHSAKLILYSVDFADVERLQRAEDWDSAGKLLADVARSLQAGGADFLMLCTNTMHKVASTIEASVSIPLLHIVDTTAQSVVGAGYGCVGLLGTRFTMEQSFYKDRLAERHGLRVLVPEPADRELVHRVIFTELCVGKVLQSSRLQCRRVIEKLIAGGAEAIILGCTELALLLGPDDSTVPLFDTTALHAKCAVERALADVS